MEGVGDGATAGERDGGFSVPSPESWVTEQGKPLSLDLFRRGGRRVSLSLCSLLGDPHSMVTSPRAPPPATISREQGRIHCICLTYLQKSESVLRTPNQQAHEGLARFESLGYRLEARFQKGIWDERCGCDYLWKLQFARSPTAMRQGARFQALTP